MAVASTRARGVRRYFETAPCDARSNAHAPSLMPDAFPAVTVPFGLTIGFNLASPSRVVSGRGCSSVSKILASAFLLLHRHRDDFLFEKSRRIRAPPALLRAVSKCVLVGAP